MLNSETARAAPRDAVGDPRGLTKLGGLYALPTATIPTDQARALVDASKSGKVVLGIDIGASGAIAVLDGDGKLIAVHDMPVLQDGPAGRRNVNAPILAGIISNTQASAAYVEFVGARPGESPSGAFAFGRSRGVIEGVLAAAGIPAAMITPAHWKRLIGIAPGKEGAKDAARSEAIRRWPGQAGLFARVKDDGRAEAALIAIGGMLRTGQRI